MMPRPTSRRSWGRYAAEVHVAMVVIAGLKTLAGQGSSALWRHFSVPFNRFDVAGVPYYAIWAVLLWIWSTAADDRRLKWKVDSELWTSRNIAVLVGAIVATDALYGFKLVHIVLGDRSLFSNAVSVGYLLSAAVGAPVIEEILFRGYLWNELTLRAPSRLAGIITAAAVTSALFVLWHLPMVFGPFPSLAELPPLHAHFAFGIVMSVLRWRFGSIGLGVVIHGLWNLM